MQPIIAVETKTIAADGAVVSEGPAGMHRLADKTGAASGDVAVSAAPRRPAPDFWQIWNMAFGFFGIQFGLALQNSNLSRIFQTLGASVEQIPLLWIAAPLTGLLVQPVVGYFSDRTRGRLGRRRPYLAAGALFAALALVVLPNARALWIAAAALWLLDAAINVAMGPIRALIGDRLEPARRPAGYAMQTFFIGAGSVVASLLPWVLARCGVDNSAAPGTVPDTVKFAFAVGAIALCGAIGWTVVSTHEDPLEFHAADKASHDDAARRVRLRMRRTGWAWTAAGIVLLLAVYVAQLEANLGIVGAGVFAYGAAQLIVGFGRSRNVFAEILIDLQAMPTAMRQLAVTQLFAWFGLFAMWTYTTAAVTEIHFAAKDAAAAGYNDGANWTGVLFAAYNAFAMLAAVCIPWMSRRLGLRVTHMINLMLGGIGLLSFLVIGDARWLLASMAGIGFAWASILSVPYALLSDSVPARKMGAYMGIFNFFIVIPQLLAASVLGFVLKNFLGNAPVNALLLGGASFIVAGLCTLRIRER